jgi:hypothetical protein
MGENGEAVKRGPRIEIEFDGIHVSECTLRTVDVDYMQMFAAAKLIEVQAEGMFMQAQMSQANARGTGLVVPRIVP